MALSPELQALVAATTGEPLVQIEIHFPDSYVHRISDRAHSFGGNAYAADITGDVTWERSCDTKFSNLRFRVSNLDRAYTDLLTTYTSPELQEADVYCFETFAGATTREERFRGKLDIPTDVDREDIDLSATELLNSILEPINALQNSPTCPWATQCRFAGGDRCSYAPATGDGRDLAVDVPGIDAVSTTLPVTDIDGVGDGDYLQIASEILLVTAVGSVSCTVARAQKGTTAAAHTAGTRITHESCGGSWEECWRRGMLHRYGGVRFFNKSGSLYWREKIFLFSKKTTMPWQSKGNTGVFGSPWGLIYGRVRLAAEALYVRDPGAHAVYFANLGVGPILGPYHPTASSPRATIWVNGKESKDYACHQGNDGQAAINWYGSGWDTQGIDYLWLTEPTTTQGADTWEDAQAAGQTYSRRAYLCGAFPSDVQADEGLPTIELICNGRVLPYYDSSGTKLGDAWTQNPAWIMVDAAINRDYGAGLTTADIDWPRMAAAAARYDALGYTFNIHLTSEMAFADFVALLCDSTLSIPTRTDNKLGLEVLEAGRSHSGVTLGESVILEGSYKHWTTGPVDRDGNSLKVTLTSPDHDYQSSELEFVDAAHVESLGGRKRTLNKKLAGVDNLAQAQAIGAFWLNLAKISRRADGVKKFRTTYAAMAINPGDIVTVDTDTEDGLGAALTYLVWTVRRVNNDGDHELTCVRWETGLFELGGVTYDLPSTGIDPTREPVPVTDLAGSATMIDSDRVRLTVTWTWPEAAAPRPAPAKVFLWIGDPEDPFDQYELLTPKGVGRDLSSYQATFPRQRFKTARVYAIAQSAWRHPANTRPGMVPDFDHQTALNGAITATQTSASVDASADLGLTAGDYVILPAAGTLAEIARVSSTGTTTLYFYTWGIDRRAYFGTTALAWPDNQTVYKAQEAGPCADVAMLGAVMPPTNALVYDWNRDAELQQNEIRVEIPRNTTGTPPAHIHIQLKATNADWPEPTEDPTGTDAYITQPHPNFVLVPTSHNLSAAHVGKLFVIKETGDRVGRYIESVTEDYTWSGLTWDKVNLNGPIPRGKGTHTWAVWNEWHKLADHNYTATIGADNLDLTDNAYKATFRINLEYTGYVRVYTLNEWSVSDPVIAKDESDLPAQISTATLDTELDRTQAPKVTGFTVTHDGYVAPDGGQRVLCTVQFTPPFPLGNFSHLLVLADYPIESGSGMEAGMGGQAGAGYFTHRIGEFWDSNVQFISQPTTEPVYFYGISINADGYYNPDWYDDGDYVEYQTTLTADDNPPGQVQNVDPEYIPGVGLQVKWDALAAADIASYEIHYRKAATEGGLATATWTDLDNTRSTFAALGVTPADSGYWFQFRVRGVDNIGQAGTWGESAGAQAYGTTLHPVSAPINLDVGKTWEYQAGVPIIHLAINWDNPTDPYYGGCEVWIIDADGGERWDLVPAGYSATGLALVGDGRTIQVHLYPMNTAGLVPDYGTYAASGNIVLTPDTVDVPEPDITARDGVNCVYLTAEIPAWGTFQKPYSDLEIYINSTNSGTGSTKILNTPVGHSSGSTERMGLTIPFPLLADIGGTWSQGTQYYFFAKLVDRAGNTSGYSADTDNSAVFLPGDLTDTGVADFNNAEEIMRFAAADRYLLVAWNAPTINGTSVYETQIQISDESSFARPVINATYNSKSGGHTFVPAVNGTFYIRVRYRNNSPAEWSSWFGRAKGDGTTYATVRTIADQTGDTGKMVGTDIEYQTTDLTGKDNIQLDVRLKSTAANAKTCYNVSVIWSATQANTKDESNIYQSGLTLSWQDNDSWVTVSGATPAVGWVGKVLQFNSATSVWDGWIITQIDATNKRVQLNGSFGAAKSGQTARVITPYWQRPNTWFKELGRDAGWHLDKSVWYSTTITEIQSGYTCYARLIPCNFYGVGTAKDISFTIPNDVGIVVDKTQAYANDTAPAGTFSGGGYQLTATANNTVDFIKTFTFAQHADELYRADSFVLCVRPGGGTPDPTTDQLLVYPVTHLSGSQDYELKVPNLDPFTEYAITLYQAKSTTSGLAMNTSGTSGKYLSDTGLTYNTSGHLYLTTPTSKTNARVYVKAGGGYNAVALGCSYTSPNYYGLLELLESSAGNTYFKIYNNGAGTLITAGTGTIGITCSTLTANAYINANSGLYTTDLECDTLRIDATPATGTITPDKVIEVNMNGTIYQIPCKAKP